MKAAVA